MYRTNRDRTSTDSAVSERKAAEVVGVGTLRASLGHDTMSGLRFGPSLSTYYIPPLEHAEPALPRKRVC